MNEGGGERDCDETNAGQVLFKKLFPFSYIGVLIRYIYTGIKASLKMNEQFQK